MVSELVYKSKINISEIDNELISCIDNDTKFEVLMNIYNNITKKLKEFYEYAAKEKINLNSEWSSYIGVNNIGFNFSDKIIETNEVEEILYYINDFLDDSNVVKLFPCELFDFKVNNNIITFKNGFELLIDN